jgi:hypothetical protein
MRTVAKGPGVLTEVFDSNLHLANALADWLPGTNAILTEGSHASPSQVTELNRFSG